MRSRAPETCGGPKHRLVQLSRPAEDRAADEVGAVPGELRWRRYRPGDDAVPEGGSESLDLLFEAVSEGFPGRACSCPDLLAAGVTADLPEHMGVGPQRLSARRAARTGGGHLPPGDQDRASGETHGDVRCIRSSHPPDATCIVPAPAVSPADHGTGARRAQSSRRIPTLILEWYKERNSKNLAHGRLTPWPRRCCVFRRGRAPAMQRGHTRRTASACRPDSGRMSSQST